MTCALGILVALIAIFFALLDSAAVKRGRLDLFKTVRFWPVFLAVGVAGLIYMIVSCLGRQ